MVSFGEKNPSARKYGLGERWCVVDGAGGSRELRAWTGAGGEGNKAR